jgi:hypothetical protein
MTDVPNSTESLLTRTKKLLDQRGKTSLREIATGADVGYEWLRSVVYDKDGNRIDDPGIKRIEKLYNYLLELYAARRFQERTESRAS